MGSQHGKQVMDEGLINLGMVAGMTITFHQTGSNKPQLHQSGNNTEVR
jgi:hypothetical protein